MYTKGHCQAANNASTCKINTGGETIITQNLERAWKTKPCRGLVASEHKCEPDVEPSPSDIHIFNVAGINNGALNEHKLRTSYKTGVSLVNAFFLAKFAVERTTSSLKGAMAGVISRSSCKI